MSRYSKVLFFVTLLCLQPLFSYAYDSEPQQSGWMSRVRGCFATVTVGAGLFSLKSLNDKTKHRRRSNEALRVAGVQEYLRGVVSVLEPRVNDGRVRELPDQESFNKALSLRRMIEYARKGRRIGAATIIGIERLSGQPKTPATAAESFKDKISFTEWAGYDGPRLTEEERESWNRTYLEQVVSDTDLRISKARSKIIKFDIEHQGKDGKSTIDLVRQAHAFLNSPDGSYKNIDQARELSVLQQKFDDQLKVEIEKFDQGQAAYASKIKKGWSVCGLAAIATWLSGRF